jgi:hypothetical protein
MNIYEGKVLPSQPRDLSYIDAWSGTCNQTGSSNKVGSRNAGDEAIHLVTNLASFTLKGT